MFDRRAIRKDLQGKRFGRLQILWPAGKGKHGFLWAAQCDDGNVVVVSGSVLLNGHTSSCGCLQKESASKTAINRSTHRMCASPEYAAFRGALNRCRNPRVKTYPDYGGRGIEFRFHSFEEFFAHIGTKPSPELVLDRINNDGHYEVGNVHWATTSESNLNRRMPWSSKTNGIR